MQREATRAHNAQVRARAQAEAAQARARAAKLKAAAAYDREQKRLYGEARAAEIASMNSALQHQIEELESVLSDGLQSHPALNFDSLKQDPEAADAPYRQWERPEPAPDRSRYLPAAPSGLSKLFGKAKYQQAVADAEAYYAQDLEQYQSRESQRLQQYQQAKAAFDASVARQHGEVDAFASSYRNGDPEAVVTYFELVLGARQYPDGLMPAFKLEFVPESRQLVIEFELPTAAVVPAVKGYRYIKSSDTVTETARPLTQVRALYASVVAQLTLRTVGELFAADTAGHVDAIVFNGVVDTIDPVPAIQSVRA